MVKSPLKVVHRHLGLSSEDDVRYDPYYLAFVSYGHHRWALGFARHDKTLGVYLVWRSPSSGMQLAVDFSITLLNRETRVQMLFQSESEI